MQYLLLLHSEEAGWSQMTPEEQAQGMAAYSAFTQALKDAGALVASARLSPSSGAKTVQTKGGKSVTMDGPFAETKEQVAGFYLIEAPDMAAASRWAEQCPGSGHGAVEVRALWPTG
ncbi:MAG: YciI family protein [Phenylobacterium sp.]|nr:MAG: YciI family protein [Phenylobacterium sp.]